MSTKQKLDQLIATGNLIFFGYSDSRDFAFSDTKTAGKKEFYLRDTDLTREEGEGDVLGYIDYSDVRNSNADVCWLDREAIKVLLAGFPAATPFTMVRIRLHPAWLFAVVGLLRRLMIGHLALAGIKKIAAKGKNQYWLVLESTLPTQSPDMITVSEAVGVTGLIEFCNKEGLQYVVLRNYQQLPALHREGGDLDILIANVDRMKLIDFLRANPGPILIDVWSVSLPEYRDMPYYPPKLAREIISTAQSGPIGAQIPDPVHSFLSFAYHAVYHKGVLAGIPSNTPEVKVTLFAENDYAGMVQKLATSAGFTVENNMEAIDVVLAQHGWRPKLDTLAKLAEVNSWIREYFFAGNSSIEDLCLGVIVCRKLAMESSLVPDIVSHIENQGFVVLEEKHLSTSEQQQVTENLRGGVWSERDQYNKKSIPAVVLVVVDTTLLGRSPALFPTRFRELKNSIRAVFDKKHPHIDSVIHSTDNTFESIEYIEEVFPDKLLEMEGRIKDLQESQKPLGILLRGHIMRLRLQAAQKNAIKKSKQFLTKYLT
jgi:hypothetical protein